MRDTRLWLSDFTNPLLAVRDVSLSINTNTYDAK